MRRHFFAAALLLFLAIFEASLWPTLIGTRLKPELVLIASSVWAALVGTEGFFWVVGGGLLLDLISGAPLGANTFALVAGNAVAALLDSIPIPSRLFRATNWVAVTTLVSHIILLVVLRINGRAVDVNTVFLNTIVPLLFINPASSILAYVLLNRFDTRIRADTPFASDLK
jgi:cell shape-determining protein MreD